MSSVLYKLASIALMTILISLKLIKFLDSFANIQNSYYFLVPTPYHPCWPFPNHKSINYQSISTTPSLSLFFCLSYLVLWPTDCGFQFTIPWSLVGLVMDKSLESNNSDLLKLTEKTYPIVSMWSCRCRDLSWCYSQSWEMQARGTSGSESAGSLPLAQCGAQDSVGSHHSST